MWTYNFGKHQLRAAEKINYPVLLVFLPGFGVTARVTKSDYAPLAVPRTRTKIRRNTGQFIFSEALTQFMGNPGWEDEEPGPMARMTE